MFKTFVDSLASSYQNFLNAVPPDFDDKGAANLLDSTPLFPIKRGFKIAFLSCKNGFKNE